MPNWGIRTGRAAALGAAALFACLAPVQAEAQTRAPTHAAADPGAAFDAPGEEDFVLLQLQVQNHRLRNELRGYQTGGGKVCVDLADMILALDLPVRLDKKSRRATGWLLREDQTITIDRDQNTVQIVNDQRPILPGAIHDTPEGWCVDTATFAGWMGVTLTPNLYQSVLRLESDTPLPFIEAIERKSRAAKLRKRDTFDLSAYPRTEMPYAPWRAPSVDVMARATVDRAKGRTDSTLRYELFASGEIATASFDARVASDSRGTPDSLRVRAFRKDPQGTLLGPLQATHAAAGDVEILSGNLAGASGVGRGAFVSNLPLQRPSRFGVTVLRGTLPLGWDAELYRNGQLLAFQSDTPDGRYEFEVNLVFGTNDLEVVLYGPQGQIRREAQSLNVGEGAVPEGKLEYWAGAIERNRDLVTFHDPPGRDELGWQYAAGAQYGLDTLTVLGANAHSMVLGGKRRQYAELGVQRTLGRTVFNLTAAQEFGRGRAFRGQALGRFGRIHAEAESFIVDGRFVSGLIGEDERAAHSFRLETVLGSGRQVVPLSAGFRRTERQNGQVVNDWLARASLIVPRLALTGYLNHRTVSGPIAAEEGTTLGLLANTRVLGVSLRADAEYRLAGTRPGFERASVVAEKMLDERSDLRFEVEFDARRGVTEFQAGYVRQFDTVALGVAAQANTAGGVGANLALNFSFGPDPFGRGLRFSHEKLARRGQAAVTVFLDRDGDGVRSPGEEAIEGVGITAGQRGHAAPTDAGGQAVVEGLNPYEPVLISIDESTLPDPFLVPLGKGFVMTPRPGIAAEVQIAVAPTGEVEGVIHGLEDTPRAGVELELVDGAGTVVARALSEFDGFFLFDRVTYGTYRLQLAASSARALGTMQDIGAVAVLAPDRTLARLGIVQVQPSTIALGPAN